MLFAYTRTQTTEEDVFLTDPRTEDNALLQKFYDRKISKEVIIFKAQYFSIEDILLQSFQFVSPAKENAKTFSPRFASIIKEAASLYELFSRHIICQLYDCTNNKNKQLKIFNYLYLDKHLSFSAIQLRSYAYYNHFDQSPEIYQPFALLQAWDKQSQINDNYIPAWWTAYNKLKHTNEGLENCATLENAIAVVGAVFVALHATYGPGVVYGMLLEPNGRIYKPKETQIFVTT